MPRICKRFTATWIIKNSSFFRGKDPFYHESPVFTAENIYTFQFRINITVDFKSEKYVSLQLYIWDDTDVVTLDVEVELCNSQNEVLCVTEKKKRVYLSYEEDCDFERVMLSEDLIEKMKAGPEDTFILRCRMWETREGESTEETSSRSCTCRTTVDVDELCYTRDVSYSESADWSNTLTFPINEREHAIVNIKAPEDEILFEISHNFKGLFQKLKCEISLLDNHGRKIASGSSFFLLTNTLRIGQIPSFLKRTMLKGKINSFCLKFKFTFPTGKIFEERIEEPNSLNLPSSLDLNNLPAVDSLLDDFRKMLFSKEHADMSFHVDSEVLSAHKCVLASRSPVFSAMFNQQMAERETGVIHISDMDAQTLKLFLEFLYTGEIEDSNWERMLDLLLTADKYQVPSLKVKCSHFLKSRISSDNVCDVVSVADLVGDQALKAAAINYIKGNVVKVFSSSKWSELIKKNAVLSSEILQNFSEGLKTLAIKSS